MATGTSAGHVPGSRHQAAAINRSATSYGTPSTAAPAQRSWLAPQRPPVTPSRRSATPNLPGPQQQRSLEDLSHLTAFTALTFLDLRNCHNVRDVGTIAACRALLNLDLSCDINLNRQRFSRHLSSLPACPSLTHLALKNNDITDFSPLAMHTRLVHLDLSYSMAMRHIPSLGHCLHLTHLDLSGIHTIDNLAPLAACTNLIWLDLSDCQAITSLLPLDTCTSLTQLRVSWFDRITGLSTPLVGFNKLRAISFWNMKDITDLNALASCTRLEDLSIGHMEGLTDIGVFSHFSILATLKLHCCYDIEDHTPLSLCTALTDLTFCSNLKSIQFVADLRAMKTLCIANCICVESLAPLVNMHQLEKLDLYYCKGLSITHICGALDTADMLPSLRLLRFPYFNLDPHELVTMSSSSWAKRQLSAKQEFWTCSTCRTIRPMTALCGGRV